jgi:uncharacterized membrane protein (DUF485 family)
MRASNKNRLGSPAELFVDLLTFDRRLAVPVIHLVYWAGLGLIALVAFAIVGMSVGVALKDGLRGILLAVPILVAGFLMVGAMTLIWRSFCEFYVAVFRISDDLAAMRAAAESGGGSPLAPVHGQAQAQSMDAGRASADYARS